MALPIPLTASRPIIAHSGGCPVTSMSRPKTPSPTTTARLPAMITRCGRNRSANTPLISENTSIGAVWAAIT